MNQDMVEMSGELLHGFLIIFITRWGPLIGRSPAARVRLVLKPALTFAPLVQCAVPHTPMVYVVAKRSMWPQSLQTLLTEL